MYKQNITAVENIRKGMILLKEAYLVKLGNEDWIEKNKDLALSAHELKRAYLNLIEKK